MKVSFYLDENVNRAVAVGLRQRGVDVLRTQEDGRSGAPDDEILDRATALNRVLFTQDDDLLVEASSRQLAGVEFGGVVFAHQLRITVGESVLDLELIAKVMTYKELVGNIIFLPL